MSSGVYVLQLKDNSKYYVGKSENIDKRINTHKECGENCAKFVKINGGVNKVLAPLTPSDKNLSNWEKDETISRMIKHGYNNVRGWEFTSTNKLTKEELDMIKISILGLGDRCRKCGNSGHFASGCSSGKAKWLQKLEECYPCNTSCNVMNNLLDSCYEESSSDENSSDNLNKKKVPNKKINNNKYVNERLLGKIIPPKGWSSVMSKCIKCNKNGILPFVDICANCGKNKHPDQEIHTWFLESTKIKSQKSNSKPIAKKTKVCNRCGRKGHTEDDCFAETDVNGYELSDDESEEEDCCFRCGRPGHYANNCYAKKHIDGYYIRD